MYILSITYIYNKIYTKIVHLRMESPSPKTADNVKCEDNDSLLQPSRISYSEIFLILIQNVNCQSKLNFRHRLRDL